MANFENITIEKGMYQGKGSLTDVLERLDRVRYPIGTRSLFRPYTHAQYRYRDLSYF